MKQISKPLAMRRNYCNLDLCLVTPSQSSQGCEDNTTSDFMKKEGSNENQQQHEQQQQQQMTIFYDGNICVCDVTELQAKLILHHARKEIDEALRSPCDSNSEPASPSLASKLYSPHGMSLKISLQRFLHKRQHRIQANSPYQRSKQNV